MSSGQAVKRDVEGVLIGHGVSMDNRMKNIPVYLMDEYRKRGTFVFGTTGVGKTRLEEIIAVDDVRTGKNLIIMDPKCDQGLLSTIYSVARQCGRLKELQLITPVFPHCSAKIDPMAIFSDPEELITHSISGIQGNDPFYGAASRLFVTPIIYGNLILAKSEGRLPSVTLEQVFEGTQQTEMEVLLKALESLPDDFAEEEDAHRYAALLKSNLAKPADYREKITTTLHSCLVPCITGNIGKIIGHADSNKLIERLEDGERVIAVVHTGTMVSPSSAAILGRMLLSMIMATVGRHYLSRKERIEPALSLHIDEAHAVINPDTLNILAMAGSANVMTHLYTQSVSQIHAALGSKDLGLSAMSNTNCKIFMRCADKDSAGYCVEHFGTREKLDGVFGMGQVTTRQVEKNVLEEKDILDLQPQEAYMMTYGGRYAFRTIKTPKSDCKLLFPKSTTNLTTPRMKRN